MSSEFAYKKVYEPYLNSIKFDGNEYKRVLCDVFSVYDDIIRRELMVVVVIKCRPHEKLIFCYKNFLDGWVTKKILSKLRKKRLDELLSGFITEYSKNSEIPYPVTLINFMPFEEFLYENNLFNHKLNDYFPSINLKKFFALIKDSQKIYLEKIKLNRVKLIDKWNERAKNRIINVFDSKLKA